MLGSQHLVLLLRIFDAASFDQPKNSQKNGYSRIITKISIILPLPKKCLYVALPNIYCARSRYLFTSYDVLHK